MKIQIEHQEIDELSDTISLISLRAIVADQIIVLKVFFPINYPKKPCQF